MLFLMLCVWPYLLHCPQFLKEALYDYLAVMDVPLNKIQNVRNVPMSEFHLGANSIQSPIFSPNYRRILPFLAPHTSKFG